MQLSPSTRILTPGASLFAEERITRPSGLRKNAQAASSQRAWRVKQSQWFWWRTVANESLPSGPSRCKTHKEDGPVATRHLHCGNSAANSFSRAMSFVALVIRRSGRPVSFSRGLTGKRTQPRFAASRTSAGSSDEKKLLYRVVKMAGRVDWLDANFESNSSIVFIRGLRKHKARRFEPS
jgi:hypothetical protein